MPCKMSQSKVAASALLASRLGVTRGRKAATIKNEIKKETKREKGTLGEAVEGISEEQLEEHRTTAFQRRVYALTQEIPKGFVTTYGAMAHILHSSPRAVGQALRRNPFAPTVPCHRVIAQGGIGGFYGHVEGRHLQDKISMLHKEGVRLVRADLSAIKKHNTTAHSKKSKKALQKEEDELEQLQASGLNFTSAVIDSESILNEESLLQAITKARESKGKGFVFAKQEPTVVKAEAV